MSMRVYYENDVDPEIRQTDSIAIIASIDPIMGEVDR